MYIINASFFTSDFHCMPPFHRNSIPCPNGFAWRTAVGYAERVNVSVHWPNGGVERFSDLNTNSTYRLSIEEDPVNIYERRLN